MAFKKTPPYFFTLFHALFMKYVLVLHNFVAISFHSTVLIHSWWISRPSLSISLWK